MNARRRTFGQLAVTTIFALLSAAFLVRSFFYGSKWISGANAGSLNFKALTIWTLIYFVVCGGIAWVAFNKPRDAE